MIQVKNILTGLKNVFFINIEDLKTIKEKNNISEIKKVEHYLETLKILEPSCFYIEFYLTYNQSVIQKDYPTLTDESIKLILDNKLKILKQQILEFDRFSFLFLKVETKFKQKLEKLQNKEDIENNYELTKELEEEYVLLLNIYTNIPAMEIKDDFFDTYKILNIDLEND